MPDGLDIQPLVPGDTSPWEQVGGEYHAYGGGKGLIRYGLAVRTTTQDRFGTVLPAPVLEAEVTVFDTSHPDNWRPHSWKRIRSVSKQPFPTVEDAELWAVTRVGVMIRSRT
jgi:hypothetical protein